MYIDPIVDTFADIMNAMSAVLFAPEGADKTPQIEAYMGIAKKYHGLMEKTLEHHGGRFAAGNQVTIADFVMASYVGNYLVNPAFLVST